MLVWLGPHKQQLRTSSDKGLYFNFDKLGLCWTEMTRRLRVMHRRVDVHRFGCGLVKEMEVGFLRFLQLTCTNSFQI